LHHANCFNQIVLEVASVHKSSEGFTVNKWQQKRSVRHRYDSTAQMYDRRYCEEQEAKYNAALNDLKVQRGEVVLDVGCGTGLFFPHIAEKAGLVVGLDISRALLLQAKKRAKKQENVFVVLADADYLPFADAVFDLVFAFTVIQNMPNPLETLKEIKQVAKEGASIVLTGLKKAIPLEVFGELLSEADLQVVSLKDDASLQCYVVVCVQSSR
jgi:ubiquinone/menaquinone biosynthesis C-methylase UbiE